MGESTEPRGPICAALQILFLLTQIQCRVLKLSGFKFEAVTQFD
jgi:hypothetical protein